MGGAPTIFGLQGRNYIISASSGGFSTSSGTYVAVTNMTVSLTVSGKTPVLVMCVPVPIAGAAYTNMIKTGGGNAFWRFTSGGADLAEGQIDVSNRQTPQPYHIHENSPAGSQSWDFQVLQTGGGSLDVNNYRLLVLEL